MRASVMTTPFFCHDCACKGPYTAICSSAYPPESDNASAPELCDEFSNALLELALHLGVLSEVAVALEDEDRRILDLRRRHKVLRPLM